MLIPSFLISLLVSIRNPFIPLQSPLTRPLQVTFSVPFIKSIYYLHIPFQAGQLRFGNFGLCYIPGSDYEDGRADCIGPRLGYYWRPEIIHWLTEAQITVGIGEYNREGASDQGSAN